MPPFTEAQVGNAVTLEGRFWSAAGVLTNPTTVTLTVTNPAGVVTTYAQATLTNASAGVWTKLVTPTAAGVTSYTFDGDGVVEAANTGYLIVGGGRNTVCSAWASVNDLDPCDDTIVAAATEAVKESALLAASDLLWRWSGYRYPGLCMDTVRPCAQGHATDHRPSGVYGWGDWEWSTGWGACACQANTHRACGCNLLSEIRLGRAPIAGILAVKVDGATLVNGTDYRVDDNEWLVRLGGNSWPCCQSLQLADTAVDTWSVSFVWGRNPPPSGVTAAVGLAAELVKACVGGDCALPPAVASVVRQGTSIRVTPELFGRDANGNIRSGVKAVDLFLAAAPSSRPGLIVSPDIDADTRRVNT